MAEAVRNCVGIDVGGTLMEVERVAHRGDVP
jgi:hypothetical protein